MAGKKMMSRTMRIDLIPDVPTDPVSARKERVLVTTSGRTRRLATRRAGKGDTRSYQALLESIYDAGLICNSEGRILDTNPRAIEFLLYGRDELRDMSVLDVISGADKSLVDALLENLRNERFTLIQAYCVRKNDTYFPAEIAVNLLELDEPRLCFFVRDITLRRQAEEMLRTEHNAIQNAGNGIAVADIDAGLEYVNPAVARMWGYASTDDLLGCDVRELLSDTDAASEMIGSVMGTGNTWTGEMRALRADGTEFDIQVSAVCNHNTDGETVGIVLSLLDISDRIRAEEAEKETERHRVMIESLGAACHHMGQPAAVLLANLELIQKKAAPDDAEVRDLVRLSVDAVKDLGDVLHKLNAVTEYKTMQYMAALDENSEEQRILEI